ncbi:MAG: ribonuclease P protein component 1 [Candidatus Bilamarchaeaceae archaeon]
MAHTLVGLEAEVVKSSARQNTGLRGKVVDETKNLVVLETPEGDKRVPKASSVFRFFLGKGEGHTDVEGKKMMFRPVERAKKMKI